MSRKVAVVTGGNRGIGFTIVKILCSPGHHHFDGDVILTARNITEGQTAVEKLQKAGLHPKFFQLDVTSQNDIAKLQQHLKNDYGGVDVLVNNAGVYWGPGTRSPSVHDQVEACVKVNYKAVANVCDALFPLLRPHARVVHLSSLYYKTAYTACSRPKQELFNKNVTTQSLSSVMDEYLRDARAGTLKQNGWSDFAYGMSKLAVSSLAKLQQEGIDKEGKEDIVINSCCPGWVRTDMGGAFATKSVEEGADTPVYLATLPQNISSPRGQLVSSRAVKKFP